MLNPEQLDDRLLEALTHLYDPDYTPPPILCEITDCASRDGATPVQSTLIQAIEALKPEDDLPPNAHLRRVYEILHKRFVMRLTQEATAERMGLSVRHLNRVQREAVHTLAQQLWERHQGSASETTDSREGDKRGTSETDFQASDWQAQTRRELASLRASSVVEAASEVAEIIRGVLELREALWPPHGIEVEVAFVQPELVAAVHPSALRQMLIAAFSRLGRFKHRAPITLFARLEDGNVRIILSTTLDADSIPSDEALIGEMLIPDGASITVRIEGDNIFLAMRMPSAHRKVTVAVIDDNADMVRFYQRASVGTPYQIVWVEDDNTLLETLRILSPDAVILDVMLPHHNGWQLLMQLRQDQILQSIPVVVCSVVREEELALSLGASHFLSKPVRPRQFIQALDQVQSLTPAKEQEELENSGEAG
jgi:CheY-like chemotaxis protein